MKKDIHNTGYPFLFWKH